MFARSAPWLLPAFARPMPREIAVIRRLLGVAMVFSMVGDFASVYQLIVHPDPMMMGVTVVLTYFAMHAMLSPGPLGRGSRWAWTWTISSALLGLVGGAMAIAMGILWLSTQPWLLPTGLVWTGLYFIAIVLLTTPRMRDWIFG